MKNMNNNSFILSASLFRHYISDWVGSFLIHQEFIYNNKTCDNNIIVPHQRVTITIRINSCIVKKDEDSNIPRTSAEIVMS